MQKAAHGRSRRVRTVLPTARALVSLCACFLVVFPAASFAAVPTGPGGAVDASQSELEAATRLQIQSAIGSVARVESLVQFRLRRLDRAGAVVESAKRLAAASPPAAAAAVAPRRGRLVVTHDERVNFDVLVVVLGRLRDAHSV